MMKIKFKTKVTLTDNNFNDISVAIKYNPIVLQPNAVKTNQQFLTFKNDIECAGACNKRFESSNG